MSEYRAISTKDAQEILLASGEWGGIVLSADNIELPLQLRGLCINVRDTIRQSSVIRTDNVEIYNKTKVALELLVSSGILSEVTKDSLLNLTIRPSNSNPKSPTIRLEKGYPIPNSQYVVLNTDDYELNELVDCAQRDNPDVSYCSFYCAIIIGENE